MEFSKVLNIKNPTMRLDADYFQKEFLDLPSFENKIGGFAIVRSGTTPRDRDDDLREGVVLLKTTDIRNRPLNSADSEKFYKISYEIAARMLKTKLLPRDVLINIVGATTDVVGRVAIIPADFPEANITQAMALIRPKENTVVPELLFSFLMCKFGNSQIRRLARPTGQYNLNIPEVESIEVPVFSDSLTKNIQCFVQESLTSRDCSQVCLTQADLILIRAIGLEDWQAPDPLTYVQNSLDAFASGRLDAEHFQPKFAELLAYIDETGEAEYLGEVLFINQRGKQPIYIESGLPVVNSKHVLTGEVRLDNDNRQAKFDDKMLLIQPGDVLMNGTGVGTIGRSAPYLHDDKAVPDNHVTILRPKPGVDPIYLSVFLNSQAGQLQVQQRLRGSSGQIELYPNDIAQFKIWVAPKNIQQEIRDAVLESFAQKKRATQLLDAAKRAVEIAIEQDEQSALEYLETHS